jgi:YesN/AraC family two-component response regulator
MNSKHEKIQILLVDDEPNILKSYVRALRGEPYTVFTATSGEAALHLLRDTQIQVVISDFRMPGMNGVEFLLASKKENPKMIRAVLSGYADESAVEAAMQNGDISKYLLKPIENHDLKIEIKKLIDLY